MKQTIYKFIFGGLLLGMVSCQKTFLDLTPPSTITDAVYFKTPSDFKAYTSGFYSQLMGWKSPYGGNSVYNYMDITSDLSTSSIFSSDIGHGTIAASTSDNRWNNNYSFIRQTNIVLSRAQSYTGAGDISQYVGEAYFFRANAYFNLLKFYGGVPIVSTVLDVNSGELQAPRNSRYDVVTQILSDLDSAIVRLPIEQNIPATDKGRISKWAVEAFKAKAELYEATWRKYNGTSTDYQGSAGPASDQIKPFLADAVAMCKDVMDNGGYSLWNYNSNATMANMSSLYLFNLEDAGSNPAGLTKASNSEFILYGTYDYTYRKGGINLSHTMQLMSPSRKFMDMCLCTDGLPPDKSPLFQGYHHAGDEFKNRDLRLLAYVDGTTTTPAAGSVNLNVGLSGYGNAKFIAYKYGTYRTDNQESQNYPIIRLAEVYLTYAEALYELNGAVTDAQLDESINKLRDRAGVAHLTNALATTYGLNMRDEIRRARAVELYLEGDRFDDLKRWGILESSLNPSHCGMVVGGSGYATDFRNTDGSNTSLYAPNTYVWGEEAVQTAAGTLKCVVIDSHQNHTLAKKDYLWPLPTDQLSLNKHLIQNPGY
ncbi:RagB/SusD family nutrient uptake outer membrane protein [Arachidicoccus sp.]|uniref:RagB/SusD family nutrient uptake outer membrane protein n=1 Tax=Arachidicoccus sp. TaxID=1872624 RepID=UPI003D1E452E